MTPFRLSTTPWIAIAAALAAAPGCTPITPDDDASGDDDTVGDDDVSDDDTTDDTVKIYDLQQDAVATGTFVTVSSVVVTSPIYRDGDGTDGGFFVQEQDGGAYSGIYVYTYADVLDALPDLARGSVITVSGEYSEYPEGDPAGSLAEITLTNPEALTIEGQGVELAPEPVDAAELADPATAEAWEGVLVETSGTVESGVDQYGQWTVDGVLVDDLFYRVEPVVGAEVIRVAGPFNFSFGTFKLLPRDEADVEIDDSTVPVTTTTVTAIQGGEVAEGTLVRLEGVIATTPLTEPYSNCTYQAFWVQDAAGGARSGIMVAVPFEEAASLQIDTGDTLTLQGIYAEYYDVSQITLAAAADVTVTASGAAPAPVEIADACSIGTGGSAAEDYEGVLVKVSGLTVTGTIDEIGYGQFEVNDCLLVDSLFFEYPDDCGGTVDATPDPASGQAISSLTGVLHYSYGAFKLEPRSAADFEGWTP